MNRLDCFFERAANLSVGVALFLIGMGFTVVGLTLLPVVGLLVALPVLWLSFAFVSAHRSHACRIVLDSGRR